MLPEIPPHKPRPKGSDKSQHDTPTTSGTKVALRTEEEQQAAAREREEREKAVEKEKEISDRRDARRKSLANRRVSFAAEATLHTFHEIEYMQNASAANNSLRKASSSASRSQAQQDEQDPPSTPPDQTEDVVPGSPEDQRDAHQKKNRRGSGVGPLTYSHNDDDTVASTVYSSDSEATEGVIEGEDMGSDSGSDSDADEVSVDLDVDEVTGTTVASLASAMSRHSDLTMDATDTLEGALRLATDRAVTQSIDEDEEVIPSFGWVKKPLPKTAASASAQNANPSTRNSDRTLDNIDATMDLGSEMELTRPIGGILNSDDSTNNDDPDMEMSMDVTKALGGILPGRSTSGNHSKAPEPHWPAEEEEGDATMELTMAVGGINRQSRLSEGDLLQFDDNEEMSMELTTVLGNVLPSMRKSLSGPRRASAVGQEDMTMDMTMDMTNDIGRILSGAEDEEEIIDDATAEMDMTMAVGRIISEPSPAPSRSHAKHIMEQEVNEADFVTPDIKSSAKKRLSEATHPASAAKSKSLGTNGLAPRTFSQSLRAPSSSSPFKSSPFREQPNSPVKRSPMRRSPVRISPEKIVQPSTPAMGASPQKTPVQSASLSRKIEATAPPRRTPTSVSKTSRPASVQKSAAISRIMSPLIVLTPQQRRLSGLGADRAGLGSPRIAAMLERRESLGQTAEVFVPRESVGPQRGVSFADPQLMAEEFERELQQDSIQNRFSGEDNNTATLKDMIASMTPKKNPFNGRKSLAVGSAAGLLGKRPFELDDDDDDEDFEPMDGVKRLKNHQGSPVKNIRLNAPPSKAETWSNSVNSTMSFSPKKKIALVTSPKSKKYLNFVESDLPTGTLSFEHTLRMGNGEEFDDEDGSRIHLQDFLNMTSIRFMELTTTKRRHTQAPQTSRDSFVPKKEDVSLERRVVAGACTVPMLELYQHVSSHMLQLHYLKDTDDLKVMPRAQEVHL